MSTQPIAAYSFLPWARQGLGVFIREGDQQAGVLERGSIDVSLQITGERLSSGTATETIPKSVQLYGPGDVIGIDHKMIVRTEPRHWITNFETNYLPFVEFYDEDFPWRYTPNKPSPDGKRLRPWLTLVVLEEQEFKDGANVLGRPLPFIEVNDAAQKFPPFDQLWFWAHVHVNGGFGVDPSDTAALATRLDQVVTTDRDLACSRLLCPRILKPNTAYHAFVVPTFETGRLAGLGKNPASASSATQSAWAEDAGKQEGTYFPYYHRWYFLTSSVGDFEYLVRLLQPRTVDPRVGRRDMDVQKPDANLPGIPELGGILRLGGALRAPLETLSEADREEYERFEAWGAPYPHAFQTALASFINLATEYGDHSVKEANQASALGPAVENDEDPLIVPPIYGRWHAQTHTLVPLDGDPARNRWVQELNLDPRHRTAAGFGTEVVQQNQETYMEAAWQQVGKVLEGNQKIRYGQMAQLVSRVWHARELSRLQARAPARFFTVTAPVQRRLLADGVTIHHQFNRSTVPNTVLSKTMRQALRPRARIARLAGFNQDRTPAQLLNRINLGEVSPAPPKVLAPELPTGKKLAEQFRPTEIPPAWLDLLDRNPWLKFLPAAAALLLLLLLAVAGAGAAVLLLAGAPLAAGAIWLIRRIDLLQRRTDAAAALDPDTRLPASVDELPASPDFRIGRPGSDPAPTFGTTDSRESLRFKAALRNLYALDLAERALPIETRGTADLRTLATAAVQGLDPNRTIPTRVLRSVLIPTRIVDQLRDPFGEVMVYPEIDLPMYEPLKDRSSELFVPNLQLIPNNSITLLETNQKFIESYMVGLNHEFARELLWREYPTDQRGSYFRQFWDVRGFLLGPGMDTPAQRERLYDIPELHRWATDSALGDHDHREEQGDKEEELVLVIRGELLKKYPTAVIYAHRAMWERTADNRIDKSRPRELAPLAPGQETNPPRDLVKTPLYEAKVDPDIYFFGFDLTADKARGGQIVDGEEDPGWFFVIKERPSEPRFGLDVPRSAPQTIVHTWNDLAWTDVLNSYEPGKFLRIGEKTVTLTNPGPGSEAKVQYDEDSRFQWRPDTHAAELAYILFQVPVLMAVHAAEMLKKPA